MSAALLGFVLGWVGSMPIGGPVSLFVFKRGATGRYRDAILLAAGAAVAEAGYCAGALFGYSLVVDRWPVLRPIVAILGALIMVALGIHFLMTRHFSADDVVVPPAPHDGIRDLTLGFSMVALNPSVMVSWLAVLAALHAIGLEPIDGGDRWLLVGGVAVGIVAWFSVLTWLLHHGRTWIRPVVFDRTLRAFGGGLCALGLYALIARAF
jgi:threonine/homoserine/homoserine lactone efflux protein